VIAGEGQQTDTSSPPLPPTPYHPGWQNQLPADFHFNKELHMYKLFQRFLREEEGQDFAEYALILGAIGVVAIAVIARYRGELQAAFEAGIEALRLARGG
jgi:Flp pilus assembly pilin Flp